MPKRSVFLSIGGEKNKLDMLITAKKMASLGFKIYATEGTCQFLEGTGIKNTRVYKLYELASSAYKIAKKKHPSILDLMQKGAIDLAINISQPGSQRVETDGYIIRRNCIDLGIPLITNMQAAQLLISALSSKKIEDLQIKSWDEYVSN